jgi:hypothetical protein
MYSTRYSCQILIKFEFAGQISNNSQIPNFIKLRAMVAELFHTDGHDEANSRFSQLCDRTKKCILLLTLVTL